MALQTATGYVRIMDLRYGADNTKLTVQWMTFQNSNWRENNPQRRWSNICENGSHTFDLSIKDTQVNPETEEEEVIVTGYLPQDLVTAHELLRNLDVKDADFKSINFQIVE